MASTTAQPLVLPPPAQSVRGSDEDLDIPAVLQRDPCDLEVLIPARNEAKRLPDTLARTVGYLEGQPYSSSVVVVYNGSFDRTADLVAQTWSERVPVCLTGRARPGKGAAVRRGFLTSRARFIGYMDADLATPIETLDVVMPLLRDWGAVVGSRLVCGAVVAKRRTVHRALGGMLFRAMARRVLSGVADTQCGFKFFDGDLARTVARRLCIDGFAFDVELLCEITQMGVAVKEVPVVWTDGRINPAPNA